MSIVLIVATMLVFGTLLDLLIRRWPVERWWTKSLRRVSNVSTGGAIFLMILIGVTLLLRWVHLIPPARVRR